MDKIVIKKNAGVVLSFALLALMSAFITYRIFFKIILGQPLEMGNILANAPDIFRIIKKILIYGLGSSPLILFLYYLIIANKFRREKLSNRDYWLVALITITYSIFWMSDAGSTWLFW